MEAQLPFVGMAKEMQRLSLAFRVGDPLLLLGPQGSGKTRLIQEALSSKNSCYTLLGSPLRMPY
jgi:MoxR-like ATPase